MAQGQIFRKDNNCGWFYIKSFGLYFYQTCIITENQDPTTKVRKSQEFKRPKFQKTELFDWSKNS